MKRAVINSIWIGPRLGPIHAACLRSFVRHGHHTVLHVYKKPDDVPDGIVLADAANLLPMSRMIRHTATGSLAIFSDLLRYEIQKQELGLYVDCDCYCLQPVSDEAYIFGFEAADFISNAVLKLPGDCAVAEELCRLKDARALIPPWATRRRRTYYLWRKRLGLPVALQDFPWGFTGPHALTWHLKKHGLERHAAPIDEFYPLHAAQTPLLLDPDLNISDITTQRTKMLHLWNFNLKNVDPTAVPLSSPLGAILAA